MYIYIIHINTYRHIYKYSWQMSLIYQIKFMLLSDWFLNIEDAELLNNIRWTLARQWIHIHSCCFITFQVHPQNQQPSWTDALLDSRDTRWHCVCLVCDLELIRTVIYFNRQMFGVKYVKYDSDVISEHKKYTWSANETSDGHRNPIKTPNPPQTLIKQLIYYNNSDFLVFHIYIHLYIYSYI